MNSLIKNIIEQRLKGALIGATSNHAAYLVRPGKKRWCFKRNSKLRRKPL